ncbi:MAG: hypothetical protein Q9161_002598 [Pseudevernia consocians]
MKTSTFKPFSFEDFDSEKEMEDVFDLKNEITRLKAKFSRAEGKVVALATAAERIHSMIDPLLTQHKIAIKMVKGLKTKESNAFLTDNKTVLAKVIDIGNKTQATFAESFPMLATMLVFHKENGSPTTEFDEWREGNGDKLVQANDAECDSSGRPVC